MKSIFYGVLALSLLGAPVAMADEHHDTDQHQGNHEGDRHDGDHNQGMHREWHHGDRFERHEGDHYIVFPIGATTICAGRRTAIIGCRLTMATSWCRSATASCSTSAPAEIPRAYDSPAGKPAGLFFILGGSWYRSARAV